MILLGGGRFDVESKEKSMEKLFKFNEMPIIILYTKCALVYTFSSD